MEAGALAGPHCAGQRVYPPLTVMDRSRRRLCRRTGRWHLRLLARLVAALALVLVTGRLCGELPCGRSSPGRLRTADDVNIGLSDRGVPFESDPLNIVSLASSPHHLHTAPANVTSGDVPFRVSGAETVSCWRRLEQQLGRRLHIVLIGDSRPRGLYHHLRTSWDLAAHTSNGSECLQHFVYKNRTDWCHYRSSSPHVDLRFFWNRLADAGLLKILESLRAECRSGAASCAHLVLLSMGTHQLRVPESTHSRRLLHAVPGLETAACALERLSDCGVQVLWKLSEPENFEMLGQMTDKSLNYAHVIYNAMVVDRLGQVAPSVRRWSSVLPPTENYIARCRLDPSWNSNPFSSPLRNCYDRLHYGGAVQEQYRSQLLRHLCPLETAGPAEGIR
ncbi:uncharacterized protein LOC122363270 isoform X2 [Amphibalanus amphitrite]|uniref:uncharacterized protein LOC122363270 isoform X2 n=1 Tax=Amphibalanus amphitrite TaxID=1232801 RepID=UPI001C912589|nr:uncharacterized protein LOC122363270 isoform X2 [Amphibalanus amphitrite]XP_043188268.1 uncharacterized protein LOC122363270 isoform X2 [Amphibalanus amphitrite]